MVQVYMNIFGLIIDLNIAIPKRKTPKNVNKTPIDVNEEQDNINYCDENINEFTDEFIAPPTNIQTQAKRFEEELKTLGIYDIPNASDIPPTYEIQDDVEIITNEFEKEQEDMIERRR
jgi:hypothetical protein